MTAPKPTLKALVQKMLAEARPRRHGMPLICWNLPRINLHFVRRLKPSDVDQVSAYAYKNGFCVASPHPWQLDCWLEPSLGLLGEGGQ
jgi:hypothetical protein